MDKLNSLMESMRGQAGLDEAKGVRGKAQNAVMQALQVHGARSVTDMARLPAFRGIHFKQIMRSIEALERAGHVRVDPGTQMVSLSESIDEARGMTAVSMFLRDIAREAEEAHQILLKRMRNKQPVKGMKDVDSLRDAANVVHNTLGWLKHYQR